MKKQIKCENCGGKRKRDGSGKGVGNKGTKRQPKR